MEKPKNTESKSARQKRRKKVKASVGWIGLGRFFVGYTLLRKYNIEAKNFENSRSLKPPFLILSNHCCVLDPFVTYTFMPRTMYWITTDAPFRKWILRFLLNRAGCIPKAKAISDSEPVRHMMDVKSRGGIIGIFPEGQSSHDGSTLPLIYSTSKLIKLLKIPILIVNAEGTYFTIPRWAKYHRKGKAFINFKEIIPASFIKESSVDEIHKRLIEALQFDSYEYQRQAMIRYEGEALAENLEEALFVCCSCNSVGTLHSKGDEFTCESCGYSVRYTVYGFLESISGDFKFDTIRDWNAWQLDFWKNHVEKHAEKNPGALLLEDPGVLVMTGYRRKKLRELCKGTIQLYPDKLILTSVSGEKTEFPMTEILGINVQDQERMEFYCRDTLYRFNFPERRTSIYKWERAIVFLRGDLEEE